MSAPPVDLVAFEAALSGMTSGEWRSTWDEPPREDQTVIEATAHTGLDAIVVGELWHDGNHVCLRREDAAGIVYLRNNGPAILAEMKALRSPDVRPVLSAAARNLRLAHDNGNCEPPCEHCGEEAASTAGDRMQTPDGDVAFLRAPVGSRTETDQRAVTGLAGAT